MSDIYSDSIYVQIKSPCKKRFPSPLSVQNGRCHCIGTAHGKGLGIKYTQVKVL